MADVQKTVEIIFGAKNDISRVADSVGTDFDKLGGSIMSVAAPLAGIADKVLLAHAAITALAVGAIALAIDKAGKFDPGKVGAQDLAAAGGAPDEEGG